MCLCLAPGVDVDTRFIVHPQNATVSDEALHEIMEMCIRDRSIPTKTRFGIRDQTTLLKDSLGFCVLPWRHLRNNIGLDRSLKIGFILFMTAAGSEFLWINFSLVISERLYLHQEKLKTLNFNEKDYFANIS